jgi:hypothetical protein
VATASWALQPLDGEVAKRRAPTCTAGREDAAAAIELEQHAGVDNATDKLLLPFLYNVTAVHLALNLLAEMIGHRRDVGRPLQHPRQAADAVDLDTAAISPSSAPAYAAAAGLMPPLGAAPMKVAPELLWTMTWTSTPIAVPPVCFPYTTLLPSFCKNRTAIHLTCNMFDEMPEPRVVSVLPSYIFVKPSPVSSIIDQVSYPWPCLSGGRTGLCAVVMHRGRESALETRVHALPCSAPRDRRRLCANHRVEPYTCRCSCRRLRALHCLSVVPVLSTVMRAMLWLA